MDYLEKPPAATKFFTTRYEAHEEERGKEAFCNYDSPLRSRQDQIELASQLSLRLRGFACNRSGRMHAKGDWTTAGNIKTSPGEGLFLFYLCRSVGRFFDCGQRLLQVDL